MLFNLAAWGVTYYVVYRQYSYYYFNQTLVSTYVDSVSYGDSRTIFGTSDPTDTLAITMGLVYSWLLWKLPFVAYAVQLTGEQPSKGLRIGSCLALLLVLLGADVLLTLFAKGFYGEWIFYAIYSLLTVAVVVVNNMGINRVK